MIAIQVPHEKPLPGVGYPRLWELFIIDFSTDLLIPLNPVVR